MSLIDPDLLRAAMLTPTSASDGTIQWGLRLAYEGPPGIGKTAVVQQVAASLGLNVHMLRASSMDPTDVQGLLMPDKITLPNGQVVLTTNPAVPQWAAETHMRDTLVFCDEMTAGSSEAVMAALLEVVQDYKIGPFRLGPHTRMIGAYNPSECAAGGAEIPAPMANRLVHLPVLLDSSGRVKVTQKDKERWCDYYSGADDDLHSTRPPLDTTILRKEEKAVTDVWGDHFSDARQMVIGFILKVGTLGSVTNKDKKTAMDPWYDLPDPDDLRVSHGWNSPRSLDTTARILATTKVHGLTPTQENTLVKGAVGESWAKKFLLWRRNMDLPTGREFIAGGLHKKWKYDDKADKTFTILNTATSFVVSQDSREAKCHYLKELVDCLIRVAEEVGTDNIVRPFYMLEEAALTSNSGASDTAADIIAPLLEHPRLIPFIQGLSKMNGKGP